MEQPLAMNERVRPGSSPLNIFPVRMFPNSKLPNDRPGNLPDCTCDFVTSSGQIVSHARLEQIAPVQNGPNPPPGTSCLERSTYTMKKQNRNEFRNIVAPDPVKTSFSSHG